jgi:AcrR family transcriptional regulator
MFGFAQMQQRAAPTLRPLRRRPKQSRAKQTSLALQDAFVRLMSERGHESLTIREIVNVAGTGLGSFYEYFANKEDLARVSVHMRSKALLLAMRGAVIGCRGRPMAEMVDGIITALGAAHCGQPVEWGVHYALERKISDPLAYAKMYERFVKEWASALACTSDGPVSTSLHLEAARVCHSIAYGLFAHPHICANVEAGQSVSLDRIAGQASMALQAYLSVVCRAGPSIAVSVSPDGTEQSDSIAQAAQDGTD